jgi:hypothetical protein
MYAGLTHGVEKAEVWSALILWLGREYMKLYLHIHNTFAWFRYANFALQCTTECVLQLLYVEQLPLFSG